MTDSTRVLGGRYRLLSLLATGGMGQVWRARDVLLDRPVAVKVLRSEYSGDQTFLSRFRAEAHLSAGLVHRNIATLFDYGESAAPDETGEAVTYLVMELVEGEPLSAVIERERRLDVARTLDILRQTAAALAVAHAAGVVHRDVKPGNVLLGDDGVVRITDFGIAWSASSVPLTLTGQVVGTPHYLPPEQAAGEKARPAGDVYALGLIGYECLAGRRAFEGDNAVAIALMQLREEPDPLPSGVPDDVRTLIGRALLKHPAERYPDGAAFRDAIEDVQAGRPLPPLPVDTETHAFGLAGLGFRGDDGPGPRRRLRRLLVPVAALVAGAGIAVAGVQWVGAPVGSPPAAAAATETGTGATAGIALVAGDYVGRPVDEVEAELRALGLRVDLMAHPSVLAPAGQVTGVSPAGTLRPGDLVTVAYATEPDLEPAAPAPEEQATTADTAAPVPAPRPAVVGGTTEPDGAGASAGSGNDGNPGNGNGNGNGKEGERPGKRPRERPGERERQRARLSRPLVSPSGAARSTTPRPGIPAPP